MRKMKKINGYLVVKFNARELREYEGTGLGEYGVIDAELYTGILDVDRGVMEYDNAGSMEEAVELARGLESELDAEEPEVKVTIVKETDETTEEEEVDAQQMIAGWENALRGQVASAHYKDVDERTAAHELYGYKVALRDLGLLDREGCYVLPDTFGEAPGPLPKKPEELLSYVCDELCRHRRPDMTQEELDAVCKRCSLERLANEADEADLRIREKSRQELNGLIVELRGAAGFQERRSSEMEARAYLRALSTAKVFTRSEIATFSETVGDACAARPVSRKRTTFENIYRELKYRRETLQIYDLGLRLSQNCPDNDCRVYLNIFNAARELDAALDSLNTDDVQARVLKRALREQFGRLEEMYRENYAVELYRKEAAKKERPPAERTVSEQSVGSTLADQYQAHFSRERVVAERLRSLLPQDSFSRKQELDNDR